LFFGRLFNFLVVQVTPVMTASIGWGTFLIFAVANALFIPVIWFYYPETKGRTLEAIDLIFATAYEEKERPTHSTFILPSLLPPASRPSDSLPFLSLPFSFAVAERMPSMTDAEVERLTQKIDIHDVRTGDPEKAVGGETDTTPSSSAPATRVASPTFGDVVKADKGN
jgi:hypothetical protein